MITIWIARDDKGYLKLYEGERPKWIWPRSLLNEEGYYKGDWVMELDKYDFPEVTWENSPQQVELKLKEENG